MMFKVVLCLCLLGAMALDPPVWPVHFSESFVESYSYSSLHTVANMYFDSQSNVIRVDRQNGQN